MPPCIRRRDENHYDEPIFVDPATGDYSVKGDSPALELGFRNFPMDRFGTRKEAFQPLIRKVTDIDSIPTPRQ
jgi:hypothetical protein